ncbi:hypothetical protein Trydic_g10630, partial [Trypoxylus dichotomus]
APSRRPPAAPVPTRSDEDGSPDIAGQDQLNFFPFTADTDPQCCHLHPNKIPFNRRAMLLLSSELRTDTHTDASNAHFGKM